MAVVDGVRVLVRRSCSAGLMLLVGIALSLASALTFAPSLRAGGDPLLQRKRSLSPGPIEIKPNRSLNPTPPIAVIENVRYRTYIDPKTVNTGRYGMHITIQHMTKPQPALRLTATNRLGEDLAVVRFQLIIDFIDGKELESHTSLGPIPANGHKTMVLAVPAGVQLRNIYYYFLRELKLVPANQVDFPTNSWRTLVHYPKTRFSNTPTRVHPDRQR